MPSKHPIAVILVLALSVGAAVAAPSRVEACSAPTAIEFAINPGDTVPIAREGVAVVGAANNYYYGLVTFRVVDLASSTEVPGSVEEVNLGVAADAPYIGPEYRRTLYVWRATGVFDPEGSYEVEISADMLVHTFPGVVAEANHPGPPAPDTMLFTATRAYEWSYDCVPTDPEAFCYYCDRRDPVGVVHLQWAPDTEAVDPFVTYRVAKDPGEETGKPVWHPGGRSLYGLRQGTLVYRERTEQYCATVTSTSLIDGTTMTSERYCVLDADLPELGPPPMPVGDGGAGTWDGGSGARDAGGGVVDAGGEALDGGPLDSGPLDGGPLDGGDAPGLGGGGGCSVTAAPRAGGVIYVAFVAAAALLRRRRR